MNITLIGMPGAGKSTVGVVLAKRIGMDFVDTDLIIQKEYNKTLSEIIDAKGIEGFKKVENDVISKLELDNTIIATGGSAVYGKEAMKHLRDISKVVYIELTEENIEDRLGDLKALIDAAIDDPSYTASRHEARNETWMYPGEGATRVADYLLARYEQLTRPESASADSVQA